MYFKDTKNEVKPKSNKNNYDDDDDWEPESARQAAEKLESDNEVKWVDKSPRVYRKAEKKQESKPKPRPVTSETADPNDNDKTKRPYSVPTNEKSPPRNARERQKEQDAKRRPWNFNQPRWVPDSESPRRKNRNNDPENDKERGRTEKRRFDEENSRFDEDNPRKSLLQEEIRIYEQKRIASQNMQKARRAQLQSEYGKPKREKKLVHDLADDYNIEAHGKNRYREDQFKNVKEFEYYLKGMGPLLIFLVHFSQIGCCSLVVFVILTLTK